MIWEKGPLEIIEMGSCPGFSCFAELALTSDEGWPFHNLIYLKSKVLRRILGKVSNSCRIADTSSDPVTDQPGKVLP